ncbi:hypothetical protein Javan425_0037 [Streptococcus phage Javan425]|uniref:Phage membrane protein n=1 Tax=Streptococcus porcinus str. Jelinkova 176 TaxID=873448 RepID=A0ABN0CUK4_STRPO|nr:hypothetical protein [Streptococcus porcinus]EGJ26950.1 hypothetical protein STRPO_0267 [Streptococcus porcinus str. Jelinkova 176]QBX18369.1 hypothetical protein Javan423_0023 [Streptococcus phage Javan423]QBX18442.1 hypothetical protein Javan425_0037 [Streptococcus phage Javan425]SQG43957.1 phage protein [Streptococcus porcinus]
MKRYEFKALHVKIFIVMYSLILTVLGYTIADNYYQPQIEGLQKQLTRTQYQLRKAREQNVEQTARIAELTNNGG